MIQEAEAVAGYEPPRGNRVTPAPGEKTATCYECEYSVPIRDLKGRTEMIEREVTHDNGADPGVSEYRIHRIEREVDAVTFPVCSRCRGERA